MNFRLFVQSMAEDKTFKPGSTLRRNRAVLSKLQLPGDFLLIIYLAVLVRQYFWWLTGNNAPAWIASAVVAAIIGWVYVSTKEIPEHESTGLPFWLVAVLPLVFVYSMRSVFPDVSFDVLNYRLLHGERALRGFIYLPGEFFPTPAPYNPAPDMVTGIFRHLLGYRLGTVANLLAMIWVARITDKLLRPFLRNAWLRAGSVLLALMAEHLLFEINNYMADLLALPLLLEATYLALRQAEWQNKRRNLAVVALLLGMSVAFKLTNAAIALPIVLLCAYRVLPLRRSHDQRTAMPLKELARTTLLCAVAFVLPLVPFSAYLYRETGSLVFPVFNGLFKSVYWPASSTWDPRWGAAGLWEKLEWPILISFRPERLSELAVYSGRISFGFTAALVGLIVVRREARLRELCYLTVASSLLWSATTGYIRYALYVEILAAIVVLALVARLAQTARAHESNEKAGRARLMLACLLGAGLIFQACLAAYYVSETEWSGRPTIFTQPGPYMREARYLLRDRSLRSFLSPETRDKFDPVDVWIVSSMKTSSLEVMLQPNAPMIGVNTGEYFMTDAGRARFEQALARVSGKRMFTLAFAEDLDAAKAALRERGLVAKEAVLVEIPFYSPRALIKTFLIEVARSSGAKSQQNVAPGNIAPNNNVASVASDHDAAYHAEISAVEQPSIMTAGEKRTLQLTVRNAGDAVWRSRVAQGWMNVVTAGNRWLTADGTGIVNEVDGRTAVPRDLKRGDQAELALIVTAPKTEGQYLLEVDMVHEGVTWFYQRGSPTLRWAVKVVK
jgi:predicted branched-subunit amino acid permease